MKAPVMLRRTNAASFHAMRVLLRKILSGAARLEGLLPSTVLAHGVHTYRSVQIFSCSSPETQVAARCDVGVHGGQTGDATPRCRERRIFPDAQTPRQPETCGSVPIHLASNKIPATYEPKTHEKHIQRPPAFVSVREKFALCFLQVTKILIEPMFRLDQLPKRTNCEGSRGGRGNAPRAIFVELSEVLGLISNEKQRESSYIR
jgi:hypothetical protein